MKNNKKPNFISEIIHLVSECPNCQNSNPSELFFKDRSNHLPALNQYEAKLKEIELRKEKLKTARDAAYNTMLNSVKAINIGFISERLFPALAPAAP